MTNIASVSRFSQFHYPLHHIFGCMEHCVDNRCLLQPIAHIYTYIGSRTHTKMESIETKLKVGYDLRVNLFLLHQLYLLLLSWIKGVADIIPEGALYVYEVSRLNYMYVCGGCLFWFLIFFLCCFLIVSNSKCFIVGMCIKYKIWTISISSLHCSRSWMISSLSHLFCNTGHSCFIH